MCFTVRGQDTTSRTTSSPSDDELAKEKLAMKQKQFDGWSNSSNLTSGGSTSTLCTASSGEETMETGFNVPTIIDFAWFRNTFSEKSATGQYIKPDAKLQEWLNKVNMNGYDTIGELGSIDKESDWAKIDLPSYVEKEIKKSFTSKFISNFPIGETCPLGTKSVNFHDYWL